jgi:hypothetical protein
MTTPCDSPAGVSRWREGASVVLQQTALYVFIKTVLSITESTTVVRERISVRDTIVAEGVIRLDGSRLAFRDRRCREGD